MKKKEVKPIGRAARVGKKDFLLTMEQELADRVKAQATKLGMNSSAFIRMVLIQRLDQEGV
jgi:predicted DNA binding CopG/RHH family protein